MIQPIHIKNARVWNGARSEKCDLYCAHRILKSPVADCIEIDLSGHTIFPGLINAHDHLELNHFPRAKHRAIYANAHQWGEDIGRSLNHSPVRELRAYPLWDRLFFSGLKNILSGVTFVAHHNPPHKPLFRKNYPVRVLREYSWSHSLHFETETDLKTAYRNTPSGAPWLIHLAEGTDEVASREYSRLRSMGLAGNNTVIIHGVGIPEATIPDAINHLRGLIWCPSSNLYLLGRTAPIERWLELDASVALGSDSRLTADGDLLDEMRCAGQFVSPERIISMATTLAARLLGLNDAGHLEIGAWADLIAVKSAPDDSRNICQISRKDLALVIKAGMPQIGDPDIMSQFKDIETIAARLDGAAKKIHKELARLIEKCKLKEKGLELDELPGKRFFIF